MTAVLPILPTLYTAVAITYSALAALVLFRPGQSRPGRWLGLACCATAVWGAAIAWLWRVPLTGPAGWFEAARSVAWYCCALHLYSQTVAERRLIGAFTTIGLSVALLMVLIPACGLLSDDATLAAWPALMAVRLGFAILGLLLVENLYSGTPSETRWHVSLTCVGLAGLFGYDVLLYADGLLYRQASFGLIAGRAAAAVLVAPLLAIGAARYRRWKIDIHISRDVAFQSVTLIVCGIFLLAVAAAGELFRRTGSDWGHVAEVALIFAGLLATALLVTSRSARSRLRSGLVDHFFTYRYDYRREWIRCIDTLTAPEAHVGLHQRVIRAIAEIVNSPAGALFVRPPQEVAFDWAGSWNMPAAILPIPPSHPVIVAFRNGEWIVELDDATSLAACFDYPQPGWLAVPLSHCGTLIGLIVLARPRAHFKLDREVFQLLRVIGREVASRLAEQRAIQILSQTDQLREYSQRFAFVIHDIKNVSGQLSMLLKNAEVHAADPAFQRDMLTTVQASVGRITRLLNRLRVERDGRQHTFLPGPRIAHLIEAAQPTCSAPIRYFQDVVDNAVAADADSFDAVVTHLLANAIEAGGGEPVQVRLQHDRLHVEIDVIDQGPGMTPEFIRDRLFRPFATTKTGGYGIGAYQARELLREAGGDLLVVSRPGEGTTMRMMLPRLSPTVRRVAPAGQTAS